MQQLARLIDFPVVRPVTGHVPPAVRAAQPQIVTTAPWSRERCEQMFVAELPTIQRIVAGLARRYRLSAADAEDFASEVQLKIISDDYAVLRKFHSRCRLRTFLTVVIRRMFLDHLNAKWGKWRPSMRSRRLGATAVRLEQLTVRDGLTFDEAFAMLTTEDKGLDREALEGLCSGCRHRGRPRFVSDEEVGEIASDAPSTDDGLAVESAQHLTDRASEVVRAALMTAPAHDRLVLRLRFAEGLSIAEIARRLGFDQKELYRTVARLLERLRGALDRSGLRADDVLSAIGRKETTLRALFVPDNVVAMPAPASPSFRAGSAGEGGLSSADREHRASDHERGRRIRPLAACHAV